MRMLILSAALALGALGFVSAPTAEASRWGRPGVGHRGGFHGGRGYHGSGWGGYRGGYGGYNRGYHGGYNRGYYGGPYRGGYYGARPSFGISLTVPGLFGGYYQPGYYGR
jgi:hypothetical protein